MSLTGNMFNEHGQLLISQLYSWLNRSHFYQFHGINYNSIWQNLGPYEIKCSRNTYIWDQINDFFFLTKPLDYYGFICLALKVVVWLCPVIILKCHINSEFIIFFLFLEKKLFPFHCLGLFNYILKYFFFVEHEKESTNEFRMQS